MVLTFRRDAQGRASPSSRVDHEAPRGSDDHADCATGSTTWSELVRLLSQPTAGVVVASACIAFGVGLLAGYAGFVPVHHWRLRRAQTRARQRADPLCLLPCQSFTTRQRVALLLGRTTPLLAPPSRTSSSQAPHGSSSSSSSGGTDITAVSPASAQAWGRRLLRRVYRGDGAAHARALEWSALPAIPCSPLAQVPASHTHASTPSAPITPLWLLQKQAFNVLYAPIARVPLWCGFNVTPASILGARQQPRLVSFFTDHTIPKSARASLAEMKRAGFDRGHLAPHASIASSAQSTLEASLLTNVVMQHRGVNRGIWKQLERMTREYVLAPGTARACQGEVECRVSTAARTPPPPPKKRASVTRTASTKRITTAAKRTAAARTRARRGLRRHRMSTTNALPHSQAAVTGAPPPPPPSSLSSQPRQKRGRGRPRRTTSTVTSTATSVGVLASLMEDHTVHSLTRRVRDHRRRRHGQLRCVPLMGSALASWCGRCEAAYDATRFRTARPRLAVCTGPLFLRDTTRSGSTQKRRGRPPTRSRECATAVAAPSQAGGTPMMADAMFMALWDPNTHNHIAVVVPNSEAGDVHPRVKSHRATTAHRRGRRLSSLSSASPAAVTPSAWRPVLESFVVEWAELERLLTASTERVLARETSTVALDGFRLFPQLQARRQVRTIVPRTRGALRRIQSDTARRVRAWGGCLWHRLTAPWRHFRSRKSGEVASSSGAAQTESAPHPPHAAALDTISST